MVHLHRLHIVDLELFSWNCGASNKGHNMLDCNFPSHVCVGMNGLVGAGLTSVSIESIPSVEVLADVSSNCLSQEKSSSWVSMSIRCEVQHKIVKDAQILALKHSSVEFFFRDHWVPVSWEGVFS
jgi:hypothetical protein